MLDLHNFARRCGTKGASAAGCSWPMPPACRSLRAWEAERAARRRSARFAADPFSARRRVRRPEPRGVVLWTRLAPKPLEPDGGMPPETVEVAWEVAADDAMQRSSNAARRSPRRSSAHSVHVEVDGLKPDRWYWYRFRAGDAESPVGRTRTLPRRRRDAGAGCGSRSPRASTTSRGCSPPTSTWPRTTSTWCSTWATTSTRVPARTSGVRKHVGRRRDQDARRLPQPPRPVPDRPAPAGACTPRARGSSPGTTTSSTTTTPTTSPRRAEASTRPSSWSGGRTPTRRTTR